jgi:hypothetical protein
MIQTFFTKVIAGLMALGTAITGLFHPSQIIDLQDRMNTLENQVNEQSLGTTNFVSGGRYKLAAGGIGLTDVTIILQSFTDPASSRELAMDDFGDIGYATIEPGTTKKEFVSFTGITQDAGSTKATLTGVTRGLQFTTPYTASSSIVETHSGGSTLIISNPPQLYNRLATKDNAEWITGIWTFNKDYLPRASSTPTYTTGDELKFVTYGQLASTSFSGTVDSSYTQKGLIQLATNAQVSAGTATGSSAAFLVPPNACFNATSSATTTVPVTNTSGKLSSGFIDQTATYTWSGTSTFSAATTTISGRTSLATTTIIKDLTILGTTTLANATPTGSYEATSKAYVDSVSSGSQILTSIHNNIVSDANLIYLSFKPASSTDANTSDAGFFTRYYVGKSGTISNMRIFLSFGLSLATAHCTTTKNSIDTSLGVSMTYGQATGTDSVNSFKVDPWDYVKIRCQGTGATSTSPGGFITVELK